jgi:hypothetical protein
MKKLMTSLFALGLGLSTIGCVNRTITRFEDSPKSPVTALEMRKDSNYVVWFTSVYQFYLCQDTGDKLVCEISCDGKNDAVCPKAGVIQQGGTSVSVR